MKNKLFFGIYPPLSTFVDKQGNLDKQAQGKLIDNCISNGVNGILALGSAGEFFSMSLNMRKLVAKFCVEHVNKRVKTLIATGACSTQESIELTLHAKEIGADGALVINPYYSPMSNECLYEFYSTIAKNVDLPILIYNFPNMTKQDIPASLIVQLAKDHKNIVGLKDSVTDVSHTREVILQTQKFRDDFCVFSGFDEHIINNLALGGVGGIPGTANFAPKYTCELFKEFENGNYTKAFEIHKIVAALSNVYSIETPYFGTLKEAFKLCVDKNIETNVIPPSKPLSKEGYSKLQDLLNEFNLIK